jgi:hypothetical protein
MNRAEWLYIAEANQTSWSLPDDHVKICTRIMKEEFRGLLKKNYEERIGINQFFTGKVSLLLNKAQRDLALLIDSAVPPQWW